MSCHSWEAAGCRQLAAATSSPAVQSSAIAVQSSATAQRLPAPPPHPPHPHTRTCIRVGGVPRQQLLHAPPGGQQALPHLPQHGLVGVGPQGARVQQVVDGRLVEAGGLQGGKAGRQAGREERKAESEGLKP